MKQVKSSVSASGLTVLYEPDETSTAVLDIVFIPGLGGHPLRSWQYCTKTERSQSRGSQGATASLKGLLRKGSLKHYNPDMGLKTTNDQGKTRERRVLRKNPGLSRSESRLLLSVNHKEEPGPRRNKSTSRLRLDLLDYDDMLHPGDEIYWPLDLLPSSCPNTRIMTWGCQVLAAHGKLLPAQHNVFDHAGDLLRELSALREGTQTTGRSIVFVAHSLGGVVLKEMLRRAEAAREPNVRDTLQSTLATIFLGCPHRNSQYGRIADAVKSMASVVLGIDTEDPVLQELSGAHNPLLDLGRQTFARQWNDYNFRVRTYYEQLPVQSSSFPDTGLEYVLRKEASSLGDPRERLEPVYASHVDMCKFPSADDTVYRSLSFTLLRLVHDEINRLRPLTPKEQVYLWALESPLPATWRIDGVDSHPDTCIWLRDLPEFRSWQHRASGGRSRILWVKGKSGSGKSVLLKSLYGLLKKEWGPLGASFIWSIAEGQTLDSVFFPGLQRQQYGSSPASVYRSLLAQLFEQDPRLRKALLSLCRQSESPTPVLDDAQVVTFFVDDYINQKIETPTRRTFIFVDAADTCGVSYLRDLLSHLSHLAANSDYNICVATDFQPELALDNGVEITTHQRNIDDILRFVSLNLAAEWEDRNRAVVAVGNKACGSFLWAEIVVGILNAAIEEGASQEFIEDTVAEMPDDVEGLYEWLFSTLTPEEKSETLALMQWAILASEPLRLDELRVAVQLTVIWCPRQEGPPSSIYDSKRELHDSGVFDTSHQFYQWVRSRSIGLLELHSESGDGVMHEPLGLQRVQVVHESVRGFFICGRGFACLNPAPISLSFDSGSYSAENYIDDAHSSLLHACVRYLNMVELRPLGHRNQPPASANPGVSEPRTWVENLRSQRRLVVSGYPFLQYAVENLLYHMLSPRFFRYYLPQKEVLEIFSEGRCRLWQQWTALMNCSASDPDEVLARCAEGPAKEFLSPVFGAGPRLARVFRKLATLVAAESYGYGLGPSKIPSDSPSAKLLKEKSNRWYARRPPPSVSSGSPRSAPAPSVFSPVSTKSPLSPFSTASNMSSLSPGFNGAGTYRSPMDSGY